MPIINGNSPILRSALIRVLASVLRITAATAVVLLLYVNFFEQRLIYFPEAGLVATPESDYGDLYFETGDGICLHGCRMAMESPHALIVSHGNGGNVGYRTEMGEFLREELRTNIFMYDYRGYGQSEGSPSEEGAYADIEAAYRTARARGFTPENIFLMGQSLGIGVSVDLPSRETIGGMILEAPFTHVGAVLRHHFRIPIDWLLKTQYDLLGKINHINVPLAVVHARGDPVVPYERGNALFEAAPKPKRVFTLDADFYEGSIMGLGVQRMGKLRAFICENKTLLN
jgi:pimeloyl-ACP methyl ester carboxylesterase